jgi:hypothetical protein
MSFPGRILSSTSIFKPALHYLSNLDANNPSTTQSQGHSQPGSPQKHAHHSSLDEIDSSPFYKPQSNAPMSRPSSSRAGASLFHSRDSSGELEPGIPLVDYSRTPSPSPYRTRTRSATQSEDEDDNVPVSLRPLVGSNDVDALRREGAWWWRRLTKSESLGGFLFGTWVGWQVYVGLLVAWSFCVGGVLVLMNRFILWSEFYIYTISVRVETNMMDSWRLQISISPCGDVVTTTVHALLFTSLGEPNESICATFTKIRSLGFDCAGATDLDTKYWIQESIDFSSVASFFQDIWQHWGCGWWWFDRI